MLLFPTKLAFLTRVEIYLFSLGQVSLLQRWYQKFSIGLCETKIFYKIEIFFSYWGVLDTFFSHNSKIITWICSLYLPVCLVTLFRWLLFSLWSSGHRKFRAVCGNSWWKVWIWDSKYILASLMFGRFTIQK